MLESNHPSKQESYHGQSGWQVTSQSHPFVPDSEGHLPDKVVMRLLVHGLRSNQSDDAPWSRGDAHLPASLEQLDTSHLQHLPLLLREDVASPIRSQHTPSTDLISYFQQSQLVPVFAIAFLASETQCEHPTVMPAFYVPCAAHPFAHAADACARCLPGCAAGRNGQGGVISHSVHS